MRDPVLWKALFGTMTPKEARVAMAKADRVRDAVIRARRESFMDTGADYRETMREKASDMIRMKAMQQLGMTAR
jgi:hypothetical protein